MKYLFPKMTTPSIFVSHVDADGAVITYRTHRVGLCPYLAGIKRAYHFIFSCLKRALVYEQES